MIPKILARGPFLPKNIKIITKSLTQRKTNPEIEELIYQTWNEMETKAKTKNHLLWNGKSLRLDDLKLENEDLTLFTSPTDYKTRASLELNISKVENLGLQYLSAGLAIGGFIETKDGFYIFNQRSDKSVDGNRVDFIGGVMDNISAKDGLDLLKHDYLEIKEEINVSKNEIESIIILGLILGDSGNVIFITSTKLNITFEDLQKLFEQKHDEEVFELVKVKDQDLEFFINQIGRYKPLALELLKTHPQ
jgi:hypothetical protein